MADTPAGKYCYDYPRPAVTVDTIIVAREAGAWQVLLIRRAREPFQGSWAIPGGFVDEHESLKDAGRRELEEETGVRDVPLEQLHTFGDPGRDPRGRTISVAYLAAVEKAAIRPRAADDAAEVGWFPLDHLPPLAFDHGRILAMAYQKVRGQPAAAAEG